MKTEGKKIKQRIDLVMSLLTVSGIFFIILFLKETLFLSQHSIKIFLIVVIPAASIVLTCFLLTLNSWLKPLYVFIDTPMLSGTYEKSRNHFRDLARQALTYPVKHITASIICWNCTALIVSVICYALHAINSEEMVVICNTVFIFSIFTNMMAYKYAREIIPPVVDKIVSFEGDLEFLSADTVSTIRTKLLIFLSALILFLVFFFLQFGAINSLNNTKNILQQLAMDKLQNVAVSFSEDDLTALKKKGDVQIDEVYGEPVRGLRDFFVITESGNMLLGQKDENRDQILTTLKDDGLHQNSPLFSDSVISYEAASGLLFGVTTSWRDFDLHLISFSGWYLFFVIFMTALAFALGQMISHDISGSLSELNGAMREISLGEGDLTKRISAYKSQETLELASWFNKFVVNLADLIGRVRSLSRKISVAGETMFNRSQDFIAEGRRQNQDVADVLQAANTYNDYRHSLDGLLSNVKKRSIDSSETAKTGLTTIKQIFNSVEIIRETSETNATVLEHLYLKSGTINEMMQLVEQLADQTRLLSFNAMLESVSAGEKGIRFSVVAEEIRALADNVTSSTGNIKKTVVEISETINNLVMSYMEEGAEITSLYQIITATREEFQKIFSISDKTAQAIEELIREIENQQKLVLDATTKINHMVKGTHSILEIGMEFQTIITSLTTALRDYEQSINKFRIDQHEDDEALT